MFHTICLGERRLEFVTEQKLHIQRILQGELLTKYFVNVLKYFMYCHVMCHCGLSDISIGVERLTFVFPIVYVIYIKTRIDFKAYSAKNNIHQEIINSNKNIYILN